MKRLKPAITHERHVLPTDTQTRHSPSPFTLEHDLIEVVAEQERLCHSDADAGTRDVLSHARIGTKELGNLTIAHLHVHIRSPQRRGDISEVRAPASG